MNDTATAAPWLPLTSAQQGLWFAHALAPDVPAYTTAEVVEFDQRIDPSSLDAALRIVQMEFEQLRSSFEVRDGVPGQVIAGAPRVRLQTVAVRDTAEAQAWCDADLARPMDPEAGDVVRWTLLDVGATTSWWYLAAHHLVLDGYGVQQLLRRVEELTPLIARGSAAGPAPERDDAAATLAEVVSDDAARLVSPDLAEAQEWWREHLDTAEGSSSLAGRSLRPAGRARRSSRLLTPEEASRLRSGARRLAVAWPDFVTAGVAAYVARMTGTPEARVGVPLANRSLEGVGQLPCATTVVTATNVLPLRVQMREEVSVAQLFAAAEATQTELRRRPHVRQEWLQRHLERTRPGVGLFGPQVNVIPFDLAVMLPGADAGLVHGVVRNLTAGPVEDLTVCLRGTPRPGRVCRLELDAHPDLYDDATLALHLERLVGWLVTLAEAEPDAPVSALPLTTEAERTLVVHTFNATEHPHDAATLGDRFARAAEQYAGEVALRHGDQEWTYRELNVAASRIAAGLVAGGVRPGDVVGIELERSFLLYAALHGVHLAGAVHLPLDPDLPSTRREEMVTAAEARTVIRVDHVPDADPARHLPAGRIAVGPEQPAYVLFTSGSTGRPKGVVVGHEAIDNRLAWQQHHLPVGPGDRVLHKTPISFDVSVWEHFWPLQYGACVVIADPGAHRDPIALTDLVVGERIDVTHFVPSMLRALLAVPSARRRLTQAASERGGRTLRHLVTSGEALTPDLVDDASAVFGVAPTNLYGPTEAAVDVTCHDTAVGEPETSIGRPVWNTQCHVLDERREPVPVGAVGELWLAGVQVAHGYLGRPELTEERFVPVPAHLQPTAQTGARGTRMYRTGDLAAWTPQGNLRYLGRTDDQVKIHGQRVELGEIEAVACAVDAVTGAVASVVVEGGRSTLALWWTTNAAGPERDAVEAALDTALHTQLPQAWIPATLRVPGIPVGTSGKADRARLAREHPPLIATSSSTAVDDPTQIPAGFVEERLARCMGEVLGSAPLGATTDFFAAGGDSLAVLALVARVEQEFGTTLSVRDVFAHPRVRTLAALLEERVGGARAERERGTAGGATEVDQVLVLRPGRSDVAPLVLLPPAGGLGWAYARLLRHLPVDLPVVVVQGEGLERGTAVAHPDLATLVASQWQALQALEPELFGPGTAVGRGELPVHVAGWSLGGMAAHSLAAHLQAQSVQVGAVVLLDAYPSVQWSQLAEPTRGEALAGVLRMAGLEQHDLDVAELDEATVVARLRAEGSAMAALPELVLQGCVAHVVAATRLVRDSTTPCMVGDLHVVVAGAPRSEDWLDVTGWEPYVTGAVGVTVLPASHGELLREPWVDEVGAVLSRLCDAAPQVGSAQIVVPV